MNTTHASSASTPSAHGLDQRFVWRVLLAIGGVYLGWKFVRGPGRLVCTVVGGARGFSWMCDGRL